VENKKIGTSVARRGCMCIKDWIKLTFPVTDLNFSYIKVSNTHSRFCPSPHPNPSFISQATVILQIIYCTLKTWRARGGVVVKALRYKPAGRGFDSRWCHWNFSVP
jgi:hypothetical protein